MHCCHGFVAVQPQAPERERRCCHTLHVIITNNGRGLGSAGAGRTSTYYTAKALVYDSVQVVDSKLRGINDKVPGVDDKGQGHSIEYYILFASNLKDNPLVLHEYNPSELKSRPNHVT